MPERLAFNQNIISYLSYFITYDMKLKIIYMQIFYLDRNTTTTIGWLTISRHIVRQA
jgi:hypothetical protein